MLSLTVAEDLFSKFCLLVTKNAVVVHYQDTLPIQSFYSKIKEDMPLTKRQADYIVKLLDKYKDASASVGLDYRTQLLNLTWRLPFREIDLSKKIYVQSIKNQLEICLRFPFHLKAAFESEIDSAHPDSNRTSRWDPEEKIRRLNLYDYNLIGLYEFALKYNFEIDDSFMRVISEIEEMWQHADNITPHSTMLLNQVELVNASNDALIYFSENKKNTCTHDIMLAKNMGYLYNGAQTTIAERIASCSSNTFWIKDYSKFFALYNQLKQRVCIILDRTSDTLAWLQHFVAQADCSLVPRDEIKVCFRQSKDSIAGINEWIKSAQVGGKVETGKILIFESKPAKWLFKDSHDVILLVTNNIYPHTNIMTRDWCNSHPCVIYLGDTPPTKQKGHTIVEL